MRTTYALLLACMLGLCLGIWLQRAWRRWAERRRGRAHNERGQRAERDAARLLEASGYTIVARQMRVKYPVTIGGGSRDVSLILDFVVEHRGEQLAAEVKSTAASSKLDHAQTRRQLLEYQLALGARRVLLVDPDRSEISEIAFPIPLAPAPSRGRGMTAFQTALFLLMTAAGAWLLSR